MDISKEEIKALKLKANDIRVDIIKMLVEAGSGHSGGPLGMADIFTILYFNILRLDPKNPNWLDRDRLVLSNGHINPVMYAAMAENGYFPVEELMTLRKLESRLQGHPHRQALAGLETTSGPLGSGLSEAAGMALVGKLDNKKWKVYCLMSDGEQEEGNTWEAVMFANKYKLDNLIAIIDRNRIEIDGNTEDVMSLGSMAQKYKAFGWNVVVVNGHDYVRLIEVFNTAEQHIGSPTVIVANTTPGKGVDFMEDNFEWHGKPPTKEEGEKALEQLQQWRERIENGND